MSGRVSYPQRMRDKAKAEGKVMITLDISDPSAGRTTLQCVVSADVSSTVLAAVLNVEDLIKKEAK